MSRRPKVPIYRGRIKDINNDDSGETMTLTEIDTEVYGSYELDPVMPEKSAPLEVLKAWTIKGIKIAGVATKIITLIKKRADEDKEYRYWLASLTGKEAGDLLGISQQAANKNFGEYAREVDLECNTNILTYSQKGYSFGDISKKVGKSKSTVVSRLNSIQNKVETLSEKCYDLQKISKNLGYSEDLISQWVDPIIEHQEPYENTSCGNFARSEITEGNPLSTLKEGKSTKELTDDITALESIIRQKDRELAEKQSKIDSFELEMETMRSMYEKEIKELKLLCHTT